MLGCLYFVARESTCHQRYCYLFQDFEDTTNSQSFLGHYTKNRTTPLSIFIFLHFILSFSHHFFWVKFCVCIGRSQPCLVSHNSRIAYHLIYILFFLFVFFVGVWTGCGRAQFRGWVLEHKFRSRHFASFHRSIVIRLLTVGVL